MDWNVSYAVSRSLVLQIGAGGQLVARSSVSREPHAPAPDGPPALLAFASGSTPADALARLRTKYTSRSCCTSAAGWAATWTATRTCTPRRFARAACAINS